MGLEQMLSPWCIPTQYFITSMIPYAVLAFGILFTDSRQLAKRA
jgi:hypothetical protein